MLLSHGGGELYVLPPPPSKACHMRRTNNLASQQWNEDCGANTATLDGIPDGPGSMRGPPHPAGRADAWKHPLRTKFC